MALSLKNFEIDPESWIGIKRLYLIGLAGLVISKRPDGPVLDAVPALAWFESLTGFQLESSTQVASIQALAAVALLAAGLFFYRRAAAIGVALLLYAFHMLTLYSLVYTKEFDFIPHTENIHAFTLAILTLQTWMPKVFEAREARALIIGVFGWTYFAAALTKLRLVGWTWASGETLQTWFATFWMYSDNRISLWLAEAPVLAKTIGWITLGFEFLFLPLAFTRRGLYILVPLAFVLHAGVWITLGISFLPSYVLLAMFLLRELPRKPRTVLGNPIRIGG